MAGSLGKALRNNLTERKVVQKIKRGDISSRNRKINSFHGGASSSPKLDTKSCCEPNNIDDYLSNVSRRNKEYIVRSSTDEISVIDKKACWQQAQETFSKESAFLEEHGPETLGLGEDIRIVRRPFWDGNTRAEELAELEEEAFIEWKKGLALKFQETKVTMTPFEKNLEVWRQLWRVVEKAHLVVQIVDARNPLLYWSKDLFRMSKEVDPAKGALLLINKADLLSGPQRAVWKNYLDNIGARFVFFSAKWSVGEGKGDAASVEAEAAPRLCSEQIQTPSQLLRLFRTVARQTRDGLAGRRIEIDEALDRLHLLDSSGPTLVQKMGGNGREDGSDDEKAEGEPCRLVVGMVGYPNVGKSSVINVLLGQKRVRVGITPGKTKHLQTLNIDEHVQLCDCPGLVFPNLLSSRAELICSGIISADHSKNLLDSVALICRRVPVRQFIRVYRGLPLPANRLAITANELLKALATHRGWLTSCQVPNTSTAARQVVKNYIEGDLLFCFSPPGLAEAQIRLFLALETRGHLADANSGNEPATAEAAQPSSFRAERLAEDPGEGDLLLLQAGRQPEKSRLLKTVVYYDNGLGNSKRKHARNVRLLRREQFKEENAVRLNAKN